jgi:polyisoprenoid-binding protein YceI
MSTAEQTAAATRWTVDPTHTTVEFAARHMMITTVKGRFAEVSGAVVADAANPTSSVVDVTIDASTIDTRTEQRDAHLRSADFLDVENHPTITFRSTRLDGTYAAAGDRFRLEGELTIRGVTKPVELAVTFEGTGKDPWGGERASFTAQATIDRRDFGLTWNQALEAGGFLVSNDIRLNLEVQVVRA